MVWKIYGCKEWQCGAQARYADENNEEKKPERTHTRLFPIWFDFYSSYVFPL